MRYAEIADKDHPDDPEIPRASPEMFKKGESTKREIGKKICPG